MAPLFGAKGQPSGRLQCPHCSKPIAENPRFRLFLGLSLLCFVAPVLARNFINLENLSSSFSFIFILFQAIFISLCLFGVDIYKKPTNG